VSTWSRRVAAALRNTRIRQGIAQLAVAWMENHINENRGQPRQGALGASGAGPDGVAHRPLKPLFGRKWVRSRPKGGFTRSRTVTYTTPGGKVKQRTEYMIETPGYRNGGQPLRDTGRLANSVNARGDRQTNGIRLVLRGLKYGLFQDMGFQTAGPNYIPLTKKGARYDSGKKARAAGMVPGQDFTGRKKGVTVPARPFLLPTRNDRRDIGVSIKLGLESILKGK
jgi:phage gpG-like protein